MREFDPARIKRMRHDGEFFWADFDLGVVDIDRIAEAFGIDEDDVEPLRDFTRAARPRGGSTSAMSSSMFPFWCASQPDAAPSEDPGLFRVNVLLHGDFLLTVHRLFDLPAAPGFASCAGAASATPSTPPSTG